MSTPPLDKNDYINLLKHYQQDSSTIKGRLWTITTWLYILLTGLLGFIAKFLTSLSDNETNNSDGFFIEPEIVLILCIIGIGLCWFARIMILSYGRHIIVSWKRSNFLLTKNKELLEMWESGYVDQKTKKMPDLPPEVKKLNGLTIGLGMIYCLIFILSIIEIIF